MRQALWPLSQVKVLLRQAEVATTITPCQYYARYRRSTTWKKCTQPSLHIGPLASASGTLASLIHLHKQWVAISLPIPRTQGDRKRSLPLAICTCLAPQNLALERYSDVPALSKSRLGISVSLSSLSVDQLTANCPAWLLSELVSS